MSMHKYVFLKQRNAPLIYTPTQNQWIGQLIELDYNHSHMDMLNKLPCTHHHYSWSRGIWYSHALPVNAERHILYYRTLIITQINLALWISEVINEWSFNEWSLTKIIMGQSAARVGDMMVEISG